MVALRQESVDRNIALKRINSSAEDVALRKESVDRNRHWMASKAGRDASLSARRAWIEINVSKITPRDLKKSLSARRAWIEIQPALC